MSARVVEFIVLGVAQSKGSMRHYTPKGHVNPIITSSNRNLKAWEQLVAHTAQHAAHGVFFTGPVSVELRIRFSRPKSLAKKVQHHTVTPDLDKLARGALDGLTGIVYRDDSQVVALSAVKTFAVIGTAPSMSVRVSEIVADVIEPLPVPLFQQAGLEY
jgi:Holliday junction resolvase RusA-like endonuclease